MKRLLVLGSHRYRTILVQVNPDRKPIWIHPKDVALACALRPADKETVPNPGTRECRR